MQQVEFRLAGDRLLHNGATRHLTAQDRERFAGWIKAYHGLAWQPGNDAALPSGHRAGSQRAAKAHAP
jgi:hypothetical protein